MKKTENRGMMGIGTLIIFIATILVAAVAAAVLVATSSSLQQRSLLTGSQAEEGISTGVEAISVQGTDGSSGADLEHFEVLIRLQAGSDALNLNNTVLIMDTATSSQSLSYNGTYDSADTGNAVGTQNYNVYYVKQGPDWKQNYISRGDIAKLKFNCAACTMAGATGGVSENKKVRLKIVPRVGTATNIEFTTPDVITDQRVSLWP
jgi:archaeal flagellin FlaB